MYLITEVLIHLIIIHSTGDLIFFIFTTRNELLHNYLFDSDCLYTYREWPWRYPKMGRTNWKLLISAWHWYGLIRSCYIYLFVHLFIYLFMFLWGNKLKTNLRIELQKFDHESKITTSSLILTWKNKLWSATQWGFSDSSRILEYSHILLWWYSQKLHYICQTQICWTLVPE